MNNKLLDLTLFCIPYRVEQALRKIAQLFPFRFPADSLNKIDLKEQQIALTLVMPTYFSLMP